MATQPLYLKNCALSAIALGISASSLADLKEKLSTIDLGSIYYHFWGIRMNSQFMYKQYPNDFANWAFYSLNDPILAEKLSSIDLKEFNRLEDLRLELIEIIETRLDDYDSILSTRREDRFNFIRSSLVIFESPFKVYDPKELIYALKKLPPGSIFYHFIDAKWHTPEKIDDFSYWLKGFGDQYADSIEKIQSIDAYFLSLSEIKKELISCLTY